ncbi:MULTISPECIES: phage minor head protein [unclassified Rhizobium]|uniref:phage minor head protein n=1 Tax=unclassified Rhizobium TaxID=2613769 RepID=UPI002889305A|nr:MULTISPECIES: phage minor head protein [unclassified Rhizobium]
MTTLRQQLDALIDTLTPSMEKAFRAAIDDIRSEIVLAEVVTMLELRDIEGAINALHIDPEAFRPLSDAVRQAFNQGGILVTQNMPKLSDPTGARVVVRWDGENQRAEQIIRTKAAQLVTMVTEDTKEMIRERIAAGYEQGQGPRTIATSIAGRIDKVTGKRVGGVIGMTAQLGRTVEKARVSLSTGDIEGMKAYLRLSKRNRIYDARVRKAIEAGKPVDAQTIGKINEALTKAYVNLRALSIARTETMMAVSTSQHEAFQQGLDKAGRDASLVTRTWRSAGDGRVRHSHMVMNGQQVVGMDLAFQAPSGAMLRYPGDTSLGAGAAEVINCRCIAIYSFDFAEAYARSRGL